MTKFFNSDNLYKKQGMCQKPFPVKVNKQMNSVEKQLMLEHLFVL